MTNKATTHTTRSFRYLPTRWIHRFVISIIIISTPAIFNVCNASVVPIVSVQILSNTCNNWTIRQTYTATEVPDSVLIQLQGYTYFQSTTHFHVPDSADTAGGFWYANSPMAGTPEQKLARINKSIFGTERPTPGRTTTFQNAHAGGCAADQGLRECVGIFVNTTPDTLYSREPYVFPFGVCSGIPPVGKVCSFSSPSANVDLGSGKAGDRLGEIKILAECSGNTAYRIAVLSSGADDGGLKDISVTVDGHPAPALLNGVAGINEINIGVRATAGAVGKLRATRTLRIDIP